ncbi:MAG: 2OG-Fe(II) oxygenase [Pseudomonadota bacterium]|nr:2OG-Fe(II) oxygenase [Pseudomonadota bacterium]
MSAQVVTPELSRWIVSQAAAGHSPEAVLEAMKASGWEEETAIEALESTMRDHLLQMRSGDAVASEPAKPVPGQELSAATPQLSAEGRDVKVLMSLKQPRIVVFGNLLSAEECEEIIALARARLSRSETVETSTGASEVNEARTSDGMFFQPAEFPVCGRLEARIATLLGWPLENGEGLQVLRYRPGAEYKPHYDYFDPAEPGTESILKRGGQRVGSLVCYLNTPSAGGATVFPDAGFEVAPVQGNAVFFSYDRAHPSTKSLHGGAPVVAGEKWVATKWMRERRFE